MYRAIPNQIEKDVYDKVFHYANVPLALFLLYLASIEAPALCP
jgi:hypothetical protein